MEGNRRKERLSTNLEKLIHVLGWHTKDSTGQPENSGLKTFKFASAMITMNSYENDLYKEKQRNMLRNS